MGRKRIQVDTLAIAKLTFSSREIAATTVPTPPSVSVGAASNVSIQLTEEPAWT